MGSFAHRAVSLAIQHLLDAIRRDWIRVHTDVRGLDAGAFCVDWWRGVDCSLGVDRFEDRWASPPLFCRLAGVPPRQGEEDERTLELLLSSSFPVPKPPPGQPADGASNIVEGSPLEVAAPAD